MTGGDQLRDGPDDLLAVLYGALAPLLADLRATGGPDLEVRPAPVATWQGPSWPMVWLSSGHGALGADVDICAPFVEQVLRLADVVQEGAIDTLWLEGEPATWPECPRHRDSHPLQAGLLAGVPVWSCPVEGTSVGEIGGLTGEPVGRPAIGR